MAYASQAGMELIYGATNIGSWADINNDGSAATKAARIARSAIVADAIVEARLRVTQYKIPLVTAVNTTPTLIEEIANSLAGLWLYEPRGAIDVGDEGEVRHSHSFRWERAWNMLDAIVEGTLKLDAIMGN